MDRNSCFRESVAIIPVLTRLSMAGGISMPNLQLPLPPSDTARDMPFRWDDVIQKIQNAACSQGNKRHFEKIQHQVLECAKEVAQLAPKMRFSKCEIPKDVQELVSLIFVPHEPIRFNCSKHALKHRNSSWLDPRLESARNLITVLELGKSSLHGLKLRLFGKTRHHKDSSPEQKKRFDERNRGCFDANKEPCMSLETDKSDRAGRSPNNQNKSNLLLWCFYFDYDFSNLVQIKEAQKIQTAMSIGPSKQELYTSRQRGKFLSCDDPNVDLVGVDISSKFLLKYIDRLTRRMYYGCAKYGDPESKCTFTLSPEKYKAAEHILQVHCSSKRRKLTSSTRTQVGDPMESMSPMSNRAENYRYFDISSAMSPSISSAMSPSISSSSSSRIPSLAELIPAQSQTADDSGSQMDSSKIERRIRVDRRYADPMSDLDTYGYETPRIPTAIPVARIVPQPHRRPSHEEMKQTNSIFEGAPERNQSPAVDIPKAAAPGCLISEWTVKEVCGWIGNFGKAYEKYMPPFRNNGIDGDMLVQLSSSEIFDLVSNSIHRKKILRTREQYIRTYGEKTIPMCDWSVDEVSGWLRTLNEQFEDIAEVFQRDSINGNTLLNGLLYDDYDEEERETIKSLANDGGQFHDLEKLVNLTHERISFQRATHFTRSGNSRLDNCSALKIINNVSVKLPNVTSLKLEAHSGDHLRSLGKLTSQCPNLLELEINVCYFDGTHLSLPLRYNSSAFWNVLYEKLHKFKRLLKLDVRLIRFDTSLLSPNVNPCETLKSLTVSLETERYCADIKRLAPNLEELVLKQMFGEPNSTVTRLVVNVLAGDFPQLKFFGADVHLRDLKDIVELLRCGIWPNLGSLHVFVFGCKNEGQTANVTLLLQRLQNVLVQRTEITWSM